MLKSGATATDPKATFEIVPMDPKHQQQIRDAIDSYLADPSQLPLTSRLVNLARKFDALPTYADMGAALLVRSDGNVLAVSSDEAWDANARSVQETNLVWKRIAYEKGAERFPDAASAFRALIAKLE